MSEPQVVVNTVEFGCENLHFAEILTGETFETPSPVKGMAEIKLSGKTSTKQIYADNGVYFEISNNSGYDVELSIYNFDDSIKTKYLGFIKDKNGVLVEPAVIVPKPLALMFEAIGDKLNRVSCLYNVTFDKPDISYKTVEEEEIPVEVITFKGKAKPFKFSGNGFIQASTTKATIKENWFKNVYKPTFEVIGG